MEDAENAEADAVADFGTTAAAVQNHLSLFPVSHQ